MKALTFTILLLISAAQAWAKPPYQVICYTLENTEAPTNTVNDNGQGAAINYTNDVPWNDITVVADAFCIPNTDDTFDMTSEAKGSTLITPAHANGVRCILSIGGGGQDSAFPTLCEAANREAFASAVTALVMQYGYDGVDIDWETPNAAAQADATSMVEDIYNKIKALPNSTVDGKPRTVSFTTVNYIDQIYDMTTLGSYTDWCFFMGYDWGDCPSLATGPLNAIATEIQDLTDGNTWSYPISKMVFGLPFYCDYYTDNCNDTTDWDTLSILTLGTPGAYNTGYAEQEYTYNGDTVYVDTAQSFCDKTNWSLNNGLLGIGMWDMGNALPYTNSTVSGIWNTIAGNASCLNLGPTSTPTKTPTPVVSSSWRIVAGGPAHTDCNNNVWAADENYIGGTGATSTNTITGALPCSTDQALYQDQRYGTSFSYVFNVPAGSYQVTLKFAETYFTAAGDREFNVAINGTTELTNFDIFATAGGENIAVDRVYNNIAPSGGAITITFGPAAVNNALIDSIQVIQQPATATPTPTFSKTATSTFTSTLTNTPTLTFTLTATNTLSATATKTNSNTATSTFTSSYTPTLTLTSTPPSTATKTDTSTAVNTSSPTVTNTASSTATSTDSTTPTASFTASPTGTSTSSPTISSTPTTSPTGTNTPVGTLTPVDTNTPMNTATSTSSPTASYTSSFTATRTPSATSTLTFTGTTTSTSTNTPAVSTATKTYSFTPSATVTNTPTATGTATASLTATYSFTATKTFTATTTVTNTNTDSMTPTASLTATPTASPANTATRTFTVTPTYTFTEVPATSTPTGTATSVCSGVPAWNGNFVYYAIGAKVTYDGELYQCIQAHTSESTWEPNVVPALWKALGVCGEATTVPALAVAQPVVYPNPVTSSTANIQLPVNDATNVKVQVFTVAMRQVQTTTLPQVFGNVLSVQMVDKGGISLANGLYYFIIQANGQKWTSKVLVLR